MEDKKSIKTLRKLLNSFAVGSGAIVFSLLCWGQVNAADNLAGGGSFGATCTDDGGIPTCSCKPPKSSFDCSKLLNRCKHTYIEVEPYEDDLGHRQHVQWVPDVTCTATSCVCDWITKTSPRFGSKVKNQSQVLAPAKNTTSTPPMSNRYQQQTVPAEVPNKTVK